MTDYVEPKVFFSRCLGFESCRYNGNIIIEQAIENMKPFVDAATVCPEVEIGLGVPRPPIRLINAAGRLRLVQPETGADVTETMQQFVAGFIESADEVDGFILKYASPSCGPREVKAYSSTTRGASFVKASGIFGGAIRNCLGYLAVEDEGRLRNFDIRHHFLAKLFALARFRSVKASGEMKDLSQFHTEQKFLLMAYNQKELRELGRIVANPGKHRFINLAMTYEQHLHLALARPPRRASAINVLMHALGYFSDRLTSREKAFFLEALQQYRNRHVPLSVPTSLMRSWIIRFEDPYLLSQTYFEPYPQALVEVLDSGKGRQL